MTFWANRSERVPHEIEVHVTSGPVEIKVTEHYMHLRSFWGTLGALLDEAEKPKTEEA